MSARVNWFKASFGSRVQIVQGFNSYNMFKASIGPIGSRVKLVHCFNLVKGSMNSRVGRNEKTLFALSI